MKSLQILNVLISLGILILIIFIYKGGCNRVSENHIFKTKKDSVEFAEIIQKKYPAGNKPLTVTFAESKNAKAAPDPIDWVTLSRYKANYDNDPILFKPEPDGRPYKGFILNATSFSALKNIGRCAQLYFRLGKKDNGEYTFMILPMDANSDVLQTAAASTDLNHDHLDPCPDQCPNNMDN